MTKAKIVTKKVEPFVIGILSFGIQTPVVGYQVRVAG
jgi:hypothetical protein